MKRSHLFLVIASVLMAFMAPTVGADGPTQTPGATQCHNVAEVAHQAAVLGHQLPEIPKKCLNPIASPPAGSGNWPVNLASALYASGKPHRDLLPWLHGGAVWSHNGRENGSWYEQWNIASAFLVRFTAEELGHGERYRYAGLYLRAQWAKDALAATTIPPAQVLYRMGDGVYSRRPVNANRYSGPFIHRAGDRHAEEVRGKFTGAWVEGKQSHALLAWAADWPGRKYKRFDRMNLGRALWTVQKLTGQKYRQTVDPAFFGLTPKERKTLRAFLQDPTNGRLARELGSWLERYPQLPGVQSTYRRYKNGVTLSVLSRSSNANKGAANVVLGGREGRTEWILPATFKKGKVPTTHGKIQGHQAIATAPHENRELTVNLKGLGDIAWEARWTANGLHFVGDEPTKPNPPPPNTGKPTPTAPASSGTQGNALTSALVALDGLAQKQGPKAEQVTRSLGGVLSALGAWHQTPNPKTHAALLQSYVALGGPIAKTAAEVPP